MKFYSKSGFAKKINVTLPTLTRWERNGKLVPTRTEDGKPLYDDNHLYKVEHSKAKRQQPAEAKEKLLAAIDDGHKHYAYIVKDNDGIHIYEMSQGCRLYCRNYATADYEIVEKKSSIIDEMKNMTDEQKQQFMEE